MPKSPRVVILSSGGLRSLVALAVVQHRAPPVKPTLLHVIDGRPPGNLRREYTQRQADHYALPPVAELERPHLYDQPAAAEPDGLPRAALATPRLLLEALAYVADHRGGELIWPISHDGQTPRIALAQEHQILAQQLSTLESPPSPSPPHSSLHSPSVDLQVPLLGYSDVQIIELGQGLDVPWEHAWSCALNLPTQCGSCPACRRRRAAFDRAGVPDPVFTPRR